MTTTPEVPQTSSHILHTSQVPEPSPDSSFQISPDAITVTVRIVDGKIVFEGINAESERVAARLTSDLESTDIVNAIDAIETTTKTLNRTVNHLGRNAAPRNGQILAAAAAGWAAGTSNNTVIAAPTGTGKSLAYLSASAASNKKTVIAVAGLALQDQLDRKDLPHLATTENVTWAVLKGRSNYLCEQRYNEALLEDSQDTLNFNADDTTDETPISEHETQFAQIASWRETTTTGDLAELNFNPIPTVRESVTVSSTECPGAANCPKGDVCWAENAKLRARKADILIVNMHILAADILTGGMVLPEAHTLIVDECHELEPILSNALGESLRPGSLKRITQTITKTLQDTDLAQRSRRIETHFTDHLETLGSKRFPNGITQNSPLDVILTEIETVTAIAFRKAKQLINSPSTHTNKATAAERAQAHYLSVQNTISNLRSITNNEVLYIDGGALHSAPLNLAPILERQLWPRYQSVICTSATIPPNFTTTTGLKDATPVTAPTPFDYSNVGLYIPKNLPNPNNRDEWHNRYWPELLELILIAQGRTLALFTSLREMNAAADYISPQIPWDTYRQSDAPKGTLTQQFTENEHSCLFATNSFWTGIDVPGPSLSLVTIDKVPWPRRGDPLHDARRDNAGPAGFMTVDVPYAAVRFGQGAGRLIRSATDAGLIVCFDERLATAQYRNQIFASLPGNMHRIRNKTAAHNLLRTATGQHPQRNAS